MVAVGDYDLERQIGAGASGTVWKAHSRGPVARVVALKRLRAGSGSSDLARLRREAGVLIQLDHPHIVRVLEVLQDGDGIALAMQYAPGGSLDDLLAERGRLSPGQVVAIAAPMAEALASAHRRGVLHGDIKPANVLFTSDGEPLLTDFGAARTLGRLTSDQVTGTAEYLAPELLDGAQPEPRADIYSLGVLCYHALAGHLPYAGPAPLAIVRAADLGEHPRLEEMPWVPRSLAGVVEQAMAGDPNERFGSADAFARALRASVPAAEVVVPGPAEAVQHAGHHGDDTRATRTFGPRPPLADPVSTQPRRKLRPARRWPRWPNMRRDRSGEVDAQEGDAPYPLHWSDALRRFVVLVKREQRRRLQVPRHATAEPVQSDSLVKPAEASIYLSTDDEQVVAEFVEAFSQLLASVGLEVRQEPPT